MYLTTPFNKSQFPEKNIKKPNNPITEGRYLSLSMAFLSGIMNTVTNMSATPQKKRLIPFLINSFGGV